jgi:hypothetical protein
MNGWKKIKALPGEEPECDQELCRKIVIVYITFFTRAADPERKVCTETRALRFRDGRR